MRYSNCNTWAEYFEKEECLLISAVTIRKKLRDIKKIGIDGRLRTGHLFKNSFYSESDVRSACADLLQALPRANEDGFIEKNGLRYGTIATFSKHIGIANRAIEIRLKDLNIQTIKGKDRTGSIYEYYPEDKILELCADIIEALPKADREGFIEKNGTRYGTIKAFSRSLSINESSISIRIESSSIQVIRGKISSGLVCNFYSESAIHSLCSNLTDNMPQADHLGFFSIENERYGTIESLSRLIGISTGIISNRIKASSILPVRGKVKSGNVVNFYSESELYSILGERPSYQANEEGYFTIGGNKYYTIQPLAKILNINIRVLRARIQSSSVDSARGRNRINRPYDFYSESDVRSACADLIAKRSNPHAS